MDQWYYAGYGVSAFMAAFAGWQSWRANKQTKATGNGFAREVKESLRRIEGKIDRHVEDHAEAGMRRRDQ